MQTPLSHVGRGVLLGIALLTVYFLLPTPSPAPTLPVPSTFLSTSTPLAVTSSSTSPASTTIQRQASTTPKKEPAAAPLAKPKPAPSTPTTTETESIPVVPSIPPPNPSELNLRTRQTVVNILCVTKQSGSFNPISGSGVVIDSRGIILTNAHVGQYFLLKDFQVPNFIDCTIRTGSPASSTYRAALIYISPRWISANAPKIKLGQSLGTGEYDYALLRITGRVDNTPLPESFSTSIPDVAYNSIPEENSTLLVSYPAELLGGILTQTSLNQVSTIATIKEGFFFPGGNESELDTFSLGGTIAAQGGSSGGAVINSTDGKLIGILVTSTAGASISERNLRGLSLSHINRSMREETGSTFQEYLAQTPEFLEEKFNRTLFPPLKKILEDAILGISQAMVN